MKTRTGYVSNSSSTSFIILVKPEKSTDVNFILRHIMDRGNAPAQLTVPQRKKEIKKEIKELDKDMTRADGIYAKIDGMPDMVMLF